MGDGDSYHWGSDPYWAGAFSSYCEMRDGGAGSFRIDIDRLERTLATDPVAFKLAEAMGSVLEHEGWDGHRGAPRLVMALMAKLSDLGVAEQDQS